MKRPSDFTIYRLFEMLPGIFTWTTLFGAVLVSFWQPLFMMYFMIAFDLYWLIKVGYVSTFLIISFYRYRNTLQIDWHERRINTPGTEDIYHLLFIPHSSEDISVVETTFESLANTSYPSERMIVVFAAEERYPDSPKIGEEMKRRYGDRFKHFLITVHPDGLPNELAGKGANLTWAGQQVKSEIIDPLGIPYEDIVSSVLDVDTCVETMFFDYLATTYVETPNRTQASYQPIPMFNNNIWDAPAIMRVAATGTTFWLMGEQGRPERLFTFSSHCMPFKAIVDVGWWETDVVSDDSRIFLQAFLRYSGDYRVVPLYMPVYMDTVLSDTWLKSLKNLYKQQRRWAWGSENIPYMLWFFSGRKDIPLRKRLYHLYNQMEGMWSWTTAPMLVFLGGYLPLWLSSPSASSSVVLSTTPLILSTMLAFANVGMVLSVVLGTLILPSRPQHHRPRKYIVMLLQWILLPVSMIIFGSFPAIEAQTRLMIGKYLGFYVTEKSRREHT